MSNRFPTYCRYGKEYARVKIDGRNIHLGKYGSKESKAKYRQLIAELASASPPVPANDSPTVAEVLEGYRAYAEKYYGDVPHGRYRKLLPTIRTVRELYADLPAREFSPKRLKVVRQVFVDRGNCRRQVNDYTRNVIAIFAWSAEEELVPGSLVHWLREVRSLRRGRCDAREGQHIEPVAQSIVDAALDHLTGHAYPCRVSGFRQSCSCRCARAPNPDRSQIASST